MTDVPSADAWTPPEVGEAQAVERLVRRLAEAEAALEALVAGEVDAVVSPIASAPILLHHAQEALRRSEERYRDLVARSPAIVCELAPDGTTLFVSQAVNPLLGYEASELIGKNWWEVLCPADERARVDTLCQRLLEGDVTDHEVVLSARDGTLRTFAWNSANRYAPDGTRQNAVAIGLDITERKAADENARRLAGEQAARAEAEAAGRQAALLAEASRVLASSLDYETTLANVARLAVPTLGDWCAVDMVTEDGTVRRLAVEHSDPAKVRWARELNDRYPPDPNAPHGVSRVLRTGEPEFFPAVTDEVLAASAVDPEHLTLLRAAGFRSAIVVPLAARGRVFGALTLVSENPARQYSQTDLRIAEDLAYRAAVAVENALLYREAQAARGEAEASKAEAEAANKAKSEFLASMSHELRTPLNAISGYAQLLEEGIRGPVNPEQRQYLQRIRKSQDHLMGLINDVLNFAKLEAGRVEFHVTDVPLMAALKAITALIEPQAQAKGLSLECCLGDPAVVVRADPDKLNQVVLNLLSNAVKFTDAGGTVTLAWDADERWAHIRVIDTGPGIPADKLKLIFDPFVQVDRDPRRAAQGTGLGLAISRDIAQAMGGDLTVTSTPGEGSTFTFRVPVRAGKGA